MPLPGLQRPCLESGRAWASALRRIEDRAVVELGRANGRAKVFREILAYLRGTVSIVDKRAVSSIGKRLGLTARCVRMHLAALERHGWVLRVHHAGLRFPGQRGWATSAYVVPAALPHVSAMPLSRRAKARAELRVPAVAAALLAAGHAQGLRQASAKAPSLRGCPPVRPARTIGRLRPRWAKPIPPFRLFFSRFRDHDRTPPTPSERQRCG
jgi:hypothetical protein